MKIYNTEQEFLKDCKDGCFTTDEDLKLNFNLKTRVNIKASNINALDINARDINALNIKAFDINAWDINAFDINARDINALNIKAFDINARDINARDIKASNINYYAVCFAYNDIICSSIKGNREHCKHFCLDGKITIKEENKGKEMTKIKKLTVLLLMGIFATLFLNYTFMFYSIQLEIFFLLGKFIFILGVFLLFFLLFIRD